LSEEINKSEVTVEAVSLGNADGAGATAQRADVDDFTPDDAITPPEDLVGLANLTANSTIRRAIIEAIARNTVGLGFTLKSELGHEDDVTDEMIAEAHVALDAIAARDRRMDRPTFAEQLFAVKTDEESCGQGALEFSRNKLTGRIDGSYHVPGPILRRLKDFSGFTLIDRMGAVDRQHRYYSFGEKVNYADDGAPARPPRLQGAGGMRWAQNEILRFAIYTTESRDYGLPRDVAMAHDYAGDLAAAQANLSFFDSGGVPPSIILISGEETKSGERTVFRVPTKTVQAIKNTMEGNKGPQATVALVPVPPGTNAEHFQLAQRSPRDMGYTLYREAVTSRALAGFRVAPVFIWASASGRYTAEVERALTVEQVFDPEQERYARRLKRLLVDLGYPQLRFHFNRLAVEADAAKREAAERMGEAGTITRQEFRDAHGYARLPEGEGRKVPDGWNSEIVTVVPPRGAENRVNDGEDQRGLRPGIGGRVAKGEGVGFIEAEVDRMVVELEGLGEGRLANVLEDALVSPSANGNGPDEVDGFDLAPNAEG
jgi:capsid portal protein